MDTNVLITAMWIGLVIGAVVSAVLTLMTLPASYLMNTFAYHHWSMRLVMMLAMFLPFIISAITLWLSSPLLIPWSLISLVPNLLLLFTVFAWKKAHYYGLFPLYESSGKTTDATGFAASLFKFFLLAIHPIVMVTDTEAITKSLGSLIVKDLPSGQEIDGKKYYPGIVNEDFTKATMAAGKLVGNSWDTTMESLTKAATLIYGASPLPPPPEVEAEAANTKVEEKKAANTKVEKKKAANTKVEEVVSTARPAEPTPNDGLIWYNGNERLGKVTSIKYSRPLDGYYPVHDRPSYEIATFDTGKQIDIQRTKLRSEPANPLAPILTQYRKEILTAIAKTTEHHGALIGTLTEEHKKKIVGAVSDPYKAATTTALDAKTLPTTNQPEIMNDIIAKLAEKDQDEILVEVANTLLKQKNYKIIGDIVSNLEETARQEIINSIPQDQKLAILMAVAPAPPNPYPTLNDGKYWKYNGEYIGTVIAEKTVHGNEGGHTDWEHIFSTGKKLETHLGGLSKLAVKSDGSNAFEETTEQKQ